MSSSKENSQYDFDNAPQPRISHRPRTQKTSLGSRSHKEQENKIFFDTYSIERETTPFNPIHPGKGEMEAILKIERPVLVAIKDQKEQKSRSLTSMGKRPIRTSYGPGRQPIGQGIVSLLTKKPLSDLPEPSSTQNEFIQEQIECERASLNFSEDPIAYFSKRKDGRGHLFIYLIYSMDPNNLDFSPYELKKVAHCDIGKDYFTMSANGIVHVLPTGETEQMTLDRWAKEGSLFKALRKLRTFNQYLLWKPLRVWKKFLMRQRYNMIYDSCVSHPMFYSLSFASASIAVSSLMHDFEDVITKSLLCFIPQRKFKLIDFEKLMKSNLDILTQEYEERFSDAISLMKELYGMLADPDLLIVKDEEFEEIRRKNPNIQQLIVLERKKEVERIRRTEQMGGEIKKMNNLLRMLDYMLLETLRNAVFDCWKTAKTNVISDFSSVWQVDIYFSDDGKVSFEPSCEVLCKAIQTAFYDARSTMDTLPRLLLSSELRMIVRDSGIDIGRLFDTGPMFYSITRCIPLQQDIEEEIINYVKKSYIEAAQHSQLFQEYYELYKLGQTWNVKNYIKTRDGQQYLGNLHETYENISIENVFIDNPGQQPIVDIKEMTALIKNLKFEEGRVGSIRAGSARGALHIDSRNIKSILTPIPMSSLHDIGEMLKELMQYKIDLIGRVFKEFSFQLNVDPSTLEEFVSYCDSLHKTSKIIPQIEIEIGFVDQLIHLFDEYNFGSVKNPLHERFERFKAEENASKAVRETYKDRFLFLLKQSIKQTERKLFKYKNLSIQIPDSVAEMNVEEFNNNTMNLKKKVIKIQPNIQVLIKDQEVLECQITAFPEYQEVLESVSFSEQLYHTVLLWHSMSQQISSVPFAHISMKDFLEDISKLEQMLNELKKLFKKPSLIVSEISSQFSEVLPYIDQLKQLSYGRMQMRHWEQLFEQCGQPGLYNPQITIQKLIDYGILAEAEKIRQMTISSEGESLLETEFNAIKTHWDEIELPIAENPPPTKNSFVLGNLDLLYADIKTSSFKLNKMLSNRFVHGIYNSVFSLANTLQNIMHILDSWVHFQSNWSLISSLFSSPYIRSILRHQATHFSLVKQKWGEIAAFSIEHPKLLEICSYPQILETFASNKSSLERIYSTLTTYLSMKREAIPRLYFLSDEELINLVSTSDFNIFATEFSKTFMGVRTFVNKSSDNSRSIESSQINIDDKNNLEISYDELSDECETSFLSRFQIDGIIGDEDEILQFSNPIQCDGPIQKWMNSIYQEMKVSVKEALSVSLSRYASSQLSNWVMTISSSIAIQTLQIAFARDIEDCFNNLETNPKVFLMHESVLKKHIDDLITIMSTPISNGELRKISSVIILLISQMEKTHSLSEQSAGYSQALVWKNSIRYKYDTQTSNLMIQFGDSCWKHGQEFWGHTSSLIFTPAIEQALYNIAFSKANNQIPLVFGPFGSGKSELIKAFACNLGQFLYTVAAFPSFSTFYLERALVGAIQSGAWIHFSNFEMLSSESQFFLSDAIQSFVSLKQNGSSKFKIGNYYVDIDSNFSAFITTIHETSIPSQLHSTIRPISVAVPQIRKVIETALASIGYKTAHILSLKLTDFVALASPLFNLPKSLIHHNMRIVDSSKFIIRQLMHSNRSLFINYYEDSNSAELFSVVKAIYDFFLPFSKSLSHSLSYDDSSKDDQLLLDMLYTHFPLFDSKETFIKNLTVASNFFNDYADEVIEKSLRDFFNKRKLHANDQIAFRPLPEDYLIEKTKTLFKMMMSYSCIIICGPPNSGKSTLINLLRIAYHALVSDVDIVNHFVGIMPLKIFTVFQNSRTWEEDFGSLQIDSNGIKSWSFGLIQSVLTNLNQFSFSHHRILKFDGELTSKFSRFLFEFANNPKLFKNNCLGSFPIKHNFHCFIETESIKSLTPSVLSISGILPLENLQYEQNPLSFRLLNPQLIINTSDEQFNSVFENLSTKLIDILSHYEFDFSDIMTETAINLSLFQIQKMIKLLRTYKEEDAGLNEKSEKITHSLKPEQLSAIIEMNSDALNQMPRPSSQKQSRSNGTSSKSKFSLNQPSKTEVRLSDEAVQFAILQSFVTVFSGQLSAENEEKFEKEIISEFKLNVPKFWGQHNLSDHFTDVFPHPKLALLQMYKMGIETIDLSYVSSRALVDLPSGQQIPLFPSQIIVPIAQFISHITFFNFLVNAQNPNIKNLCSTHDASIQEQDEDIPENSSSSQNKKKLHNIIVYGNDECGKTSFLKFAIKIAGNITPIIINTSTTSNVQNIIDQIAFKTSLLSKRTIQVGEVKNVALIFNGITPEKTQIIEFIREIAVTHSIALYSPIDPKYLEYIRMHKFFIIIKTSEAVKNQLDKRFLSHFAPIRLDPYNKKTKEHIFTRAMNALGVGQDLLHISLKIGNILNYNLRQLMNVGFSICHLSQKNLESEEYKTIIFRILMTSFGYSKNYSQIDSNLSIQIRSICEENGFAEIFSKLDSERLLSRVQYEFQPDSCIYFTSEVLTNSQDLREKLSILSNSDISETTLSNYTSLDDSIGRPGHHCILLADTNCGRMQLLKYFGAINNFKITDVTVSLSEKQSQGMYLTPSNTTISAFSSTDLLLNETSDSTKNSDANSKLPIKNIIRNVIKDSNSQIIEFRLTESNINALLYLIDIVIKQNLLVLFTPSELHEMINGFLKKTDDDLSLEEKQKALKEIQALIKAKIHLAIIPYYSLPTLPFMKYFDIVQLHVPENEKIVVSYCPIETIRPVLLKIGDIAQKMIQLKNDNLFYDFVSLFVADYNAKKNIKDKRKEQISIALDFIEKTSKHRDELQRQIEDLEPNVKEIQETRQKEAQNRKDQLKKLEDEKQEILDSKSAIQVSLSKKECIQQQKNELVEQSIKIIEDQKNALTKLNENDLLPMRLQADQPSDELKKIFEALALLLRKPKDFDTTGKVLLQDPNMIASIIEQIDIKSIDIVVAHECEEMLVDKSLSSETLMKIIPCLAAIRILIDNIIKFVYTRLELAQITEEVNKANSELEIFIKNHQWRVDEINTEIVKLSKEEPPSEAEKKFNNIKRELDKETKILSNSEISEKWKKESTEMDIGNSILFSLYITYCLTAPIEISDELFELSSNELKAANIPSESKEVILSTLSITRSPLSPIIGSLPFISRIPLILDPDMFILQYFLSKEKENKNEKLKSMENDNNSRVSLINTKEPIPEARYSGTHSDKLSSNVSYITYNPDKPTVVISAKSTENFFINMLGQALTEGHRLVVSDADSMTANLGLLFWNKADLLARFGLQPNKRDEAFEVILISEKSEPEEIDRDLLLKVSLLNGNGLSILKIQNTLKDFFNRMKSYEAQDKIDKYEEAKRNQFIKLPALEDKVLDNFVAVSKDTSAETISMLSRAKDALQKIKDDLEYARKNYEEIQKQFDGNEKLAHLAETFWFCLSRYMPKISQLYYFKFSDFMKVLETTFNQHSSKRKTSLSLASRSSTYGIQNLSSSLNDSQNFSSSSTQGSNVTEEYLRNGILSWVLPGMSFRDGILYLFLVTFTHEERNWEDLAEIISKIQDQIIGKIPINFQDIHSSTTDPFLVLKEISLPQLFPYVITYIKEFFGENFEQRFVPLQIDSALSSQSFVPTIIQSSYEDDPMQLLYNLVKSRARSDSFDVISLSEDLLLLESARKSIMSSLGRGNWVLIHISEKSGPTAFSFLSDIYATMMRMPTINSSFRLIISSHDCSQISQSLIGVSKHVYIEDFPSPKHTLQQAYSLFGSSLRGQTSGPTIHNQRKLFYMISLIFAQIRFRHFIEPFGFTSMKKLSFERLREALDYVHQFIDSNSVPFPVRNLREFLLSIPFGGSIFDTQDRRRIRALLASMLPSSILNVPTNATGSPSRGITPNTDSEDQFAFLLPDSNESEIWGIPNDGPISSLQAKLSAIPLFPTTDILLITKAVSSLIFKYDMSVWLSKSFVKLSEPIEIKPESFQIDSINFKDYYDDLSPIKQFWINESVHFNIIIKQAKDIFDLGNRINSLKNSPSEILSDLKEMRQQIISHLEQKWTHSPLNLQHIHNPRLLFLAYIEEESIAIGLPPDQLMLEFSIGGTDGIEISGLWVCNGAPLNSRLIVPSFFASVPFTKIPLITGKVVKKGPRVQESFVCPLYKKPFFFDILNKSEDIEAYDGDLENFIIEMVLPSEKNDKQFLLNGTSLYTSIPQHFITC